MRNGIKKLLAFLIIAAAVLSSMWLTLTIKYRAIEGLYRSTQLEIRAMEAEQYVNTIEYGIKYGKQLEYFFDIEELLRGVYMTSSYMEGVYVLSSGGDLLFYAGGSAGRIPDVSQLSLDGKLYGSVDFGDALYVYMDISGQDGAPQGKLLIKLDGDALHYLVRREKAAALRQSLVISLEVCALGAVIIIGAKTAPGRKRLRLFILLLSVCLLLSQGLDCAIETVKIRQTVGSLTAQSAQKIAQVIQEQIDNVVKMGVSAADISDINGYLRKNASSCEMIDALTLGANNKVQVQISQNYVRDTVSGFAGEAAVLLLGILGACLVLNGAVWFVTRPGQEIKINIHRRGSHGKDNKREDPRERREGSRAETALRQRASERAAPKVPRSEQGGRH